MEIDPRDLTPQHLPAIRKAGFNRVSFGVQDLDEKVQVAVNRVQPMELNRRVVEESRELGFDSVNVDLIYGLPYQTVGSYERTLDKVLEISPDRMAVFNYAHVPWMKKHQKIIPVDALPTPEERLQILKLVIERLTGAGYVYIGMDHFAKPTDELSTAQADGSLHRNFMGYTTKANTHLYGIGVSSISEVGDCYAQNTRKLSAYSRKVSEGTWPTMRGMLLSDDDRLRKRVISDLLVNLVVDKGAISNVFGIDFDAYFSDALGKLETPAADGLIELSDTQLRVTELGRVFIRTLAMPFDAYLGKQADGAKPIYSRTV